MARSQKLSDFAVGSTMLVIGKPYCVTEVEQLTSKMLRLVLARNGRTCVIIGLPSTIREVASDDLNHPVKEKK